MGNTHDTQPVPTPALMSTIVEIVSAPFRPNPNLGYFASLGYFPTDCPNCCDHSARHGMGDSMTFCGDCGETFECDHPRGTTVWDDIEECYECETSWPYVESE